MTTCKIKRVATATVGLVIMPILLFSQVLTGSMRTDQYYPILKNKTVGIVANHASVAGKENIVDKLLADSIRVIRIFSPEHGFRLDAEAGQNVDHSVDPISGVQVVSLYGARKKPTGADLSQLDVVLFDIQDVGVRFYTYISTLSYMMEACAEQGIKLVVLDRPNPNGHYIDGPVLEQKYKSFVGLHAVPVVYGMTIGEYALMVNGEGWLANRVKCDLQVIPMLNYHRDSLFTPEVKPSPNLPNLNSILLYPSLCFFEGTMVSIGRGTLFPFEVYGYPENSDTTFSFTPGPIPGMSDKPMYEGQRCFGADLRGFYRLNPGMMGRLNLGWLMGVYMKWGGKPGFFNNYFDQLAGTENLRRDIEQGVPEKRIRTSWKPGIEKFKKIRVKYLLYQSGF